MSQMRQRVPRGSLPRVRLSGRNQRAVLRVRQTARRGRTVLPAVRVRLCGAAVCAPAGVCAGSRFARSAGRPAGGAPCPVRSADGHQNGQARRARSAGHSAASRWFAVYICRTYLRDYGGNFYQLLLFYFRLSETDNARFVVLLCCLSARRYLVECCIVFGIQTGNIQKDDEAAESCKERQVLPLPDVSDRCHRCGLLRVVFCCLYVRYRLFH